ncbi:PRAME family member 12-like [Perognathus longimembris pacificus]|uniref:PRAME family member 12-like n=1 Tax=Perognathus longimembris pacificus TaxID=214514 RepID=UPI002019CDAB|nr:PRAME family member 12-like [Perognathus longimembris pacificus]
MRTTPPTLLQLAAQSLLENPALAVSALEELPCDLFPLLFLEALNRRHMELLKAMVQAWPFPCLPLGPLLSRQDQEPLQMALDGLDMLLAQKDRPRRCKLQVLDLTKEHQSFWDVWPGAIDTDCSQPAPKRRRNQLMGAVPGPGEQQPLRVTVDLSLKRCDENEPQNYLFEWAGQKKCLVQLCCRKLQIWEHCYCNVISELHQFSFLDPLELMYMEEVEVNCPLSLSTLAMFAPYLGKMRNLQKLFLSHIYVPECMSSKKRMERATVFISQFSNFCHLQQLYMNRVSFLQGNLYQILRSLKTPLETLSITHCRLRKSDLKCLPRCLSTRQLTHLSLKGVSLIPGRPGLLRVLLEQLAATLEILNLEDCGIEDSHLTAILPALSHCSKLTKLCLYGNYISLAILKNLLCHTASLSQLCLELYPVPLETYEGPNDLRTQRGSLYCAELMDTLRAIRQPKMVSFGVEPCPQCGYRCFYYMDSTLHCSRRPA